MWRKRAIALVGIAALVAVATLVAAHYRNTQAPSKTPPPPSEPAPAEVTLTGRVQARSVLNVRAPIEGVIERFLSDVGDDVFEGEVLAHIKSAKLDANRETAQTGAERAQTRVHDLETALIAARLEGSRARADAIRTRAELDRAERNYARQKLLMREGATPRLVFEKAEKDYNTLKTDAESLEQLARRAEDRLMSVTKELDAARTIAQAKAEELDDAKAELAAGDVHAPADGTVVGRSGQPGETVNRAATDLFQIAVNLTQLQVVLSPDPKTLERIRPGAPALIQIAEAPEGITASVREVKSGQVFVDFASPSPAVRPGLTAQVRLRLG
jgi:multidrug efflux pump subunit AcrA (membrane-fusion protein)